VAKYCSANIEKCCGRYDATDHKKSYCKSEEQICVLFKRKLKCSTKWENCPSYILSKTAGKH